MTGKFLGYCVLKIKAEAEEWTNSTPNPAGLDMCEEWPQDARSDCHMVGSEVAVRQPQAGGSRENPLKRLLKPHFKQWGRAAGQKQATGRQAGLAKAIRKGVLEGLFSELSMTSDAEAESQSATLSAQLQLWLTNSLCVYSGPHGLERADVVTLVFWAPSVLTDSNPH